MKILIYIFKKFRIDFSCKYSGYNICVSLIGNVFLMVNCQSGQTGFPVSREIQTPLDAYVHTADSSYHYQVMYQDKKENYTYVVLKMVSQQWLSSDEVADPVWWHWISIVIPDTIRNHTALMWIGGGARDDDLPQKADPVLQHICHTSGSVAASIHNVPNQPVHFNRDTIDERYEDEIIAYGWRKFLEDGAGGKDAIWLARLPMTRAVVRGMDAVSDLVYADFHQSVDHFVVSGASKRGWTTWTTAAEDDRVVAIVPIVIDLLNIVPSFEHHWRNYGFWAPAVGDYVHEGIMDWFYSKEFKQLLETTEPYSYRDRYTMPKLLINAADDQFFVPDSWQFYWDDLPGEKFVRYVPNTGHSLRGTDALQTLSAFYQSIAENIDRPELNWSVTDSTIRINTSRIDPPDTIKLWHAFNPDSRDFRIETVGKAWVDSTLTIETDGDYSIQLTSPLKGWEASFVELTYNNKTEDPLKVTTGVVVLPHKYPFGAFRPAMPKGTITE